MNIWVSQTLVECLGWTLVHFVWQGLLIAALLAAYLRLARNRLPNRRYVAGCLALLLLAVTPVITFRYVAAQIPALPIDQIETAPTAKPIIETTLPDTAPKTKIVVAARHDVSKLNWSERLELLFPWLVAGWSLGVLALSCRLLGGWIQIQRLRRNTVGALEKVWHDKLSELAQRLGVTRPVRLLQSALVEVPTVIGWLRPIILLPASCIAGLSPAQLEAILAHELAHIRRHDYLVNLLQSVVETVLFYHPAVWWVSRQVRAERENCCDDLAVEVCGDRVVYARALATLEGLRLAPAQLALAAGGPPLLPRIRRLAGQSATKANRPAWPMAGIVVLALMTALAIGLRGNQAQAKEDTGQTESKPAGKLSEPPSNTVPKPTLYAQAKPVYTGAGRKVIFSKLDSIRVDSIAFDHTPLTEVIRQLAEIARSRDSDKQGINFFIDRSTNGPAPNNAGGIDPATGLPNIDNITITIAPALTNLRLSDVLDAITRSADYPIAFSVLDYAIKFRVKDPSEFMETRTFHVDPNTFQQGLQGVIGVPFGNTSSGANGISGNQGTGAIIPRVDITGGISGVTTGANTQNTRGPSSASTVGDAAALQVQVRQFLTAAGMDLDTNNTFNVGKRFTYSDGKGLLMIRSTAKDLDAVQSALHKLNAEAVKHPGTNQIQNGKNSDAQINPAGTNKNLVWEDNKDIVAVRIETNDLETARAALDKIKTAPENPESHAGNLNKTSNRDTQVQVLPEINIKVKFVEIDGAKAGGDELLGKGFPGLTEATNAPSTLPPVSSPDTNALSRVTNSVVKQFTGILTAKQYETVMHGLEQKDGTDILTTPEVTTTTGRQCQIQAVTITTVVTTLKSSRDEKGNVHDDYQTQPLPFGPTVDVIPQALADGTNVEMKVIATVSEFLGYDDPKHAPKDSPKAEAFSHGVMPLPKFRLRQLTTDATVADGCTIVLGGVEAERVVQTKGKVPLLGDVPLLGRLFRTTTTTKTRKNLLVFITPTLINPDGTRMHPDDEEKTAAK